MLRETAGLRYHQGLQHVAMTVPSVDSSTRTRRPRPSITPLSCFAPLRSALSGRQRTWCSITRGRVIYVSGRIQLSAVGLELQQGLVGTGCRVGRRCSRDTGTSLIILGTKCCRLCGCVVLSGGRRAWSWTCGNRGRRHQHQISVTRHDARTLSAGVGLGLVLVLDLGFGRDRTAREPGCFSLGQRAVQTQWSSNRRQDG